MDSDSYVSSNEDEQPNPRNSEEEFLDGLEGIGSSERDKIKYILKSKLMNKDTTCKLNFQQEVNLLHRQDTRTRDDFRCLRQYLQAVEQLPLDEEHPGPLTANKIFVMKYINDHFQNIAIKSLNMFAGTDCRIVRCRKDAEEGSYLGYKNDFHSDKPSVGAVIDGVFDCHTLHGMIVFTHTQHMFKHPGIVQLIDRNNRKKFVDKYLAFPVDLSKFTFLFFVDDFESIPPNLREHFHMMEYTWIHVVKITSRTHAKVSSAHDTSSVRSLDTTITEESEYPKKDILSPE